MVAFSGYCCYNGFRILLKQQKPLKYSIKYKKQ